MEQKYISGLFVYPPHEKAPEFVKGKLSVQAEKLSEWLLANKDLANEKGFISIDLLVGRDGKWYAKVNDWKPGDKPEPKKEEVTFGEEINPDDIPF